MNSDKDMIDSSGRTAEERAEYDKMLAVAQEQAEKAEQVLSRRLKTEDEIIQELAPLVSDNARQDLYLKSSKAMRKATRLRDRAQRRAQTLGKDIKDRDEDRKRDGHSQTSRWTLGRSAKLWEKLTGTPHLLGGSDSVQSRIAR
jgi:hypothetical protein